MFTRQELLQLEKDCTDEKLSKKIQSMLYVDLELKEQIKEIYKNRQLIYIEKSSNSNDYYIHHLENDNSKLDEIEISIKLTEEYEEKHNIDIRIYTVEHDSIDEFWHYSNCIPVYAREDIRNMIIKDAKVIFNKEDYETFFSKDSLYNIDIT